MLWTVIGLLVGEDSNRASALVLLASLMFVTFVSLPVHESAHALAAHWMGDDTGKLKGRITLNPFAHLTWPGLMMMLLLGFGYAKPVPVNIRNFKNRKLGFALTSLAGPVSNLLTAFLFCLFAGLVWYVLPFGSATRIFYSFFYYVAIFNVSLALFNLIPVPPLDGSRLVTLFLPDKIYYTLLQYERYFIIGIFALSFIIGRFADFSPISFVAQKVVDLFMRLFDMLLA